MFSHRNRNQVTALLQGALVLLVGLTMTAGPFGSPQAARAASTIREPSARLQLVLKEVTIHDDNEHWLLDLGEFVLTFDVWRCAEGVPAPCNAQQYDDDRAHPDGRLVTGDQQFSAGSGSTIKFDQVYPAPTGPFFRDDSTYSKGFAVYPGQPYVVRFEIIERDYGVTGFEQLGAVTHVGNTPEDGLGLGTFTRKAASEDYSVTYEIRHAPLPDLRVGGIRVHDLIGTSNKLVCMGVANHEPYDADAFETAVTVNGAVPPGGRASAGHLRGGDGADICVEAQLPNTGQVKLGAIADASHLVTETNEANNTYEMTWSATLTQTGAPESGEAEPTSSQPDDDAKGRPIPSSSPTPLPMPSPMPVPTGTPSAAAPDLTVKSIKLNGQVPDGKDDCKAGKNVVIVTVKNGGKGTAGLFTTRLSVDGVDVAEQSAVDLEAGKEAEVRFEGIQLKKGDRKLTVLVDSNRQITETDEDNNTRTVTARCA